VIKDADDFKRLCVAFCACMVLFVLRWNRERLLRSLF
jgi:hypothetical protein